jgi:hypothetical protein
MVDDISTYHPIVTRESNQLVQFRELAASRLFKVGDVFLEVQANRGEFGWGEAREKLGSVVPEKVAYAINTARMLVDVGLHIVDSSVDDGPRSPLLCPDLIKGIQIGCSAEVEGDKAKYPDEHNASKDHDIEDGHFLTPCLFRFLALLANEATGNERGAEEGKGAPDLAPLRLYLSLSLREGCLVRLGDGLTGYSKAFGGRVV